MNHSVTITDSGRESVVTYREGSRAITGYQEFGGANVLAIVSMGSVDDWRAHHAWVVDRRAQILRYIADEVIRQKAPGCSVEIDEASGVLVLRKAGTSSVSLLRAAASGSPSANTANSPPDASWVFLFSRLRARFAMVVLGIALILGAAVWIKTRILVVESPNGAPFGSTLRTDTHLATLISQLQPYTPSLRHDSTKERFTLSVFLVPLDGSAPKLVRLARDLPAGGYSLARVIGSDGSTMWIAANDLYGVSLRTYSLVTADEVARANPTLDRIWMDDTRGMDIVEGRLQMLARDRSAAYALDPDTLRASEVTPRAVARQYSSPPLSRYMAAASLTSLEVEYRNASLLRLHERSEPLRLSNPDSVLMLYTSGDGVSTQNTLFVARVEVPSGRLLWSNDTGLDRFKLEQILPGEQRTAFRGTRPPVPNRVSEPLIVILDHATGQLTTHSLWQ